VILSTAQRDQQTGDADQRADPRRTGDGNVQVTAYGGDGVQCKLEGSVQNDGTPLRCYTPTGTLTDTLYVVMVHS
jgi:hypothetical protein